MVEARYWLSILTKYPTASPGSVLARCLWRLGTRGGAPVVEEGAHRLLAGLLASPGPPA